MTRADAIVTTRRAARTAPADLSAFCARERPRLVGALTLYTGDPPLAEELAQEALLATCRNWSRVREMASPGGWTHRAAINLANSYFRRRRIERRALRRHGSDDGAYDLPDIDRAVRVRDAIRQLPRDQRAAVVLRYYADLSAQQVGEVLDRSPDAVRALTHRAIVSLRSSGLRIEEEDDDA